MRVLMAMLALVLVGGLRAQTPPAPVGMTLQQFQVEARSRLLDRDADGDGKISQAEFEAAAADLRGTAVKAKAGDGAPAARGGMGGGRMADRMFQRFDTNGDGYLDKTEIDAMLAARFERLDANHDGILTAEEREASRGMMRGRMGAEQ